MAKMGKNSEISILGNPELHMINMFLARKMMEEFMLVLRTVNYLDTVEV
jgi:hypothetical protein